MGGGGGDPGAETQLEDYDLEIALLTEKAKDNLDALVEAGTGLLEDTAELAATLTDIADDRLATIFKIRRTFLSSWLETGSAAMWSASQSFRNRAADKDTPAPFSKSRDCLPVATLRQTLGSLGSSGTTDADLKSANAEASQLMALHSKIVDSVRSAAQAMTQAVAQKEAETKKAAEAAEKKRKREAEKVQRQADLQVVKAQKAAAKHAARAASKGAVADLFSAEFLKLPCVTECPRYSEDDFHASNRDMDFDIPFCVRSVPSLDTAADQIGKAAAADLAEFDARFPTATSYKDSGRAHKTLVALSPMASKLPLFSPSTKPELKKYINVTAEDSPDQAVKACVGNLGIGTGAVFAFHPMMRFTGTEVMQTGSFRYHLEGKKAFVAIRADVWHDMLKGKQPDGRTEFRMSELLTIFQGIKASDAVELHLPPGSLFYGVVAERDRRDPCNRAQCSRTPALFALSPLPGLPPPDHPDRHLRRARRPFSSPDLGPRLMQFGVLLPTAGCPPGLGTHASGLHILRAGLGQHAHQGLPLPLLVGQPCVGPGLLRVVPQPQGQGPHAAQGHRSGHP